MTNQQADKKENSWNETLRTVIFAMLLAVVFRSFLFEPFHIPSGSMKNNLLVGDYLFVSKYSYGYSRYSFPLGLPLFKGRVLSNTPKRGDIVVFREPSNPRVDFIKRLIGLPGDRIQVRDGILYINDVPLPRKQLDDYMDDENPRNIRSITQFAETLPEGKIINILKERRDDTPNNTKVFEVPKGHYFMMGDNRDNSQDSRFPMVGYVPETHLVGRAEIIFFSTDGSAVFSNPISWFSALRGDRFFKTLH